MLAEPQAVSDKKLNVIIEEAYTTEKNLTAGFIKRTNLFSPETKPKNQKTNFSAAKQAKKRLVDFKQIQAPWLEKYPMIQQEVKQIIKKYKEEITKDAEALFQEFPKSALLPYKLYIEEIKQFKPDNSDIISVRMIIYTYTGGAHGGKNYYNWNWSNRKKKFLSLDEVITSKQLATLITHTRDTLFERQKQGDEYDKHRKKHIQRGTSKKEDFKVWNLNQSGIVFVFPEYQVASYASGSFEIYVPLDLLQ